MWEGWRVEGEKGCECGEGGDRLSVSIHAHDMVDVWVVE